MTPTWERLRRQLHKPFGCRGASKAYGRWFGFYAIALVALFLIGLHGSGRPAEEAVPAFSSGLNIRLPATAGAAEPFFRRWFAADVNIPRYLLQNEIPLLALTSHAGEDLERMNFRQLVVDGALYHLTGINLAKPVTFLASSIPLLANLDPASVQNSPVTVGNLVITPANLSRPESQGEVIATVPANKPVRTTLPPPDQPDIIIYHTHTTESFKPTSGQDFTSNLNLSVAAVGEELAAALTAMNIRVVHDKTIHDLPGRIGAYQRAENTIAALVKRYPSAEIVIDLHRDALPKETVTATLNGQTYARVSLQVGTDKIYKHPNWRENYELALQVGDEMERLYPGLLRGVTLREDRFNQHYHRHALLLEVGSNENSQAEAERTARLLAVVLAKFIKDS